MEAQGAETEIHTVEISSLVNISSNFDNLTAEGQGTSTDNQNGFQQNALADGDLGGSLETDYDTEMTVTDESNRFNDQDFTIDLGQIDMRGAYTAIQNNGTGGVYKLLYIDCHNPDNPI